MSRKPEDTRPPTKYPRTAWGYASDPCPEIWTGCYVTREEAIHYGRENYAVMGLDYESDSFFVCSGTISAPSTYCPDAADLEDILIGATSDAGEASEGWPDADLQPLVAIMRRWLDENTSLDFWMADSEPEEVML